LPATTSFLLIVPLAHITQKQPMEQTSGDGDLNLRVEVIDFR
jgi:hypothetical protein